MSEAGGYTGNDGQKVKPTRLTQIRTYGPRARSDALFAKELDQDNDTSDPPSRSRPMAFLRCISLEQGSGPLVLLCHAFSGESWYSWEAHQLKALADAELPRRRARHARLRQDRPARRRSTSTRCFISSATWSACSMPWARRRR